MNMKLFEESHIEFLAVVHIWQALIEWWFCGILVLAHPASGYWHPLPHLLAIQDPPSHGRFGRIFDNRISGVAGVAHPRIEVFDRDDLAIRPPLHDKLAWHTNHVDWSVIDPGPLQDVSITR